MCRSLSTTLMLLVFSKCVVSSTGLDALKIPSMPIGKDVNGKMVNMPMGGLGTYLYNDSVTEVAVVNALTAGVRLIDTANMYGNEVGVGNAIRRANVPRAEIFVSSKVPGGLTYDDTIAHHQENLKNLSTPYVDLLLSHTPCAIDTTTFKISRCGKAARQETWRALEAIYKKGQARAIGVSHYCQQHLEDIMEINTVPISVNQAEWHVGMGPDPNGVVSFCKKNGISFQSFTPLCGECSSDLKSELYSGKLTSSIGSKHNATGVQVALRWLVQNGSPVIPKTSNIDHLHEDLDLWGSNWNQGLSATELSSLNAATSPPRVGANDCQIFGQSTLLV